MTGNRKGKGKARKRKENRKGINKNTGGKKRKYQK